MRLARLTVLATGAVTLTFLAAPLAAEAQPAGKIARIGITVTSRTTYHPFLQGLREASWVQGQNLIVERRSARGQRERTRP